MMHIKNLLTTAPIPGSDNWHTAVITVDPTTAEQLLEGNNGNRRIAPGTVARYAAAMRNGDWMTSSEPIVFSPSGRLLNGQHRLRAVVASGMPQRFLCMFGVDERVFSVMDRGKVRTLSDAHNVEKKLAEAARLLATIAYPNPASSAIVVDSDFLRMVKILESPHAMLSTTTTTTAVFFSSAPARVAAMVRILAGEDPEWVCNMYRALVLVDTQRLPPVGGAAVAAVANGRWKASAGGQTSQHLALARAWGLFRKDGAARTRVPPADVEKSVEEVRFATRQAVKDAGIV